MHGGAQETPPQHFSTLNGEYPGGDPPFKCAPLGNGSFSVDDNHRLVLEAGATLKPGSEDATNMLHGGWRNEIAREVTCVTVP